jgi:hypothetical protein
MLRVLTVSGYLFLFVLNTKETKILIRPLAEIKSQICFHPHAGPPPHLARAIAPARKKIFSVAL